MQILIGRKTQHFKSPFDVLYAGHDGRELLAAAEANAEKGYARLEKIQNPMTVPVNVAQHLRQKKEAAERLAKERQEAEAAEKLALETKNKADELKAKRERLEANLAEARLQLTEAEKPAEKKKAQEKVTKAEAALKEFEASLIEAPIEKPE
jgi:LPS O-antigen subunit length determinant protein (WzzB/FepE family)